MDQPSYFILSTSVDGSGFDGPLTEGEVLKRITPSKNGETYYGHQKFLKSVPDLNSSKDGILIIKGEIIVPKATEVVTKMTLP